jgi:putative membrane protein
MLADLGLEFEPGMVTADVDTHAAHRASRIEEHNAQVVVAGVQPAIVIAAVIAGAWYWRRFRRLPDDASWSRSRGWFFLTGLALIVLATSEPAWHATTTAFFWWITQALLLLLILPILLMLGQPIELIGLTRNSEHRRAGRRWRPPETMLRSPLFGASLVPLTCVILFFGPIPGWSIHRAAVGIAVQFALIAIGLLIAFPLVGLDEVSTAGAVGVAMVFGLVELLVDAIPGIVMRLSTHPVTNFFDYRVVHAGQPDWLTDQRRAGAILWCVAELLDVPFLIVIFARWIRADAREAAAVDRAIAASTASAGTDMAAHDDAPWFLSDPQLRDRFGNGQPKGQHGNR